MSWSIFKVFLKKKKKKFSLEQVFLRRNFDFYEQNTLFMLQILWHFADVESDRIIKRKNVANESQKKKKKQKL